MSWEKGEMDARVEERKRRGQGGETERWRGDRRKGRRGGVVTRGRRGERDRTKGERDGRGGVGGEVEGETRWVRGGRRSTDRDGYV